MSNCPTSFNHSSLCMHMSDRFVPSIFRIAKRPTGYNPSIFKTLICPTGSCFHFQNIKSSDRLFLSTFKTSSCPTGSWVQLSEYRNVWLVISLFLKQLYVRQVHTFDFQNIKMSDRLSPYIFKILICPTDSYLQLSENRNVRQVISFNFETSICPTDSYLQLVEYRNVRQVIFLYFKVFIWLT